MIARRDRRRKKDVAASCGFGFQRDSAVGNKKSITWFTSVERIKTFC